MQNFNTLFFTVISVLCCLLYIFPEVLSTPFVANLVKKNGVIKLKTNTHVATSPFNLKSNDVSKSEFEEHLDPLPDDPSDENGDSEAVDKPILPKSLSIQSLLKERWSSENQSISKDMKIERSYTFSMKFDKLQLNFIGSRYFGCTVKIKCSSSTLPMKPDDFIQITDGLGGQIIYSQSNKFTGYRKPSQNATDIYVRYQGKNPSVRCTARCMKKTEGYIRKLGIDPSFVPSIDTTCNCGIDGKRTSQAKIVGGEEATPFEIPWQMAIVPTGIRYSHCGASLINERYALSAAHCTDANIAPFLDADNKVEVLLHAHVLNELIIVRTNDSANVVYTYATKEKDADEQSLRIQVEEIINHPLDNPTTHPFDVSLLRFKEKIEFPQRTDIKPICLESWNAETDYAGQMALVSGWGRVKNTATMVSNTLQKVYVKMTSIDFCNTAYKPYYIKTLNSTGSTAPSVCGGYLEEGVGACHGDSGGPLSLKSNNKWRQIGIASNVEDDGCEKGRLPVVCTNVGEVRQWIQRMVHHDTKWCQE